MARTHLTLTLRKPWWAGLAIRGAVVWAWLGLPFDQDAFAAWLAGHFKFSAGKTVIGKLGYDPRKDGI